jgi:predicted Zn-dependent protease with MMP-like domain
VGQRSARDRRGRGLRGRLLSPVATVGDRHVVVPAWRSRAARFDDLVRDAVEALEERWAAELSEVEFAVEDVPGTIDEGFAGLVSDDTAGGAVPLGLVTPAGPGQRARVVVFRRPLEARGADLADLAELVHEVVVDQVAQLLGLDPDVVDPPG